MLVHMQAPEERNYHIFYYMLMGMPAEQKKILSLGNAAEYNYLTMGKCTSCEGRDDVKEYAHFRSALKILMFTDNDSWEVSRLLAAILHLGNVDYEATIVNNLEGCEILQSSHFKMASQLLEVDPKALEKSLTQRSFMTARESVTKPLASAQAVDCRDAFVKAIYGRLFLWVVGKINAAVYKPAEDSKEVPQSIGLLDIFGFENFAKNRFTTTPMTLEFSEKNRDALSSDLIQLVETSTNKLLKQAFHDVLSSSTIKSSVNPRMIITSASSSLRQASDGKKRVPTLTGQFRQSLDSLMKTLTVCQPYFIRCIKPNDFKRPMLFDRELCMRQLRYSGMMETIRIRKAGYPVRYTFEEFLIRYRVLLRTSLCDPKKESKQKCCESICESVLSGEGDWKTGKTKIFLKDIHDTMLELERMKELNEKALLIQKVLRGFKYRREYLRKKAAALVIQKHWRGHKGRKLYKVKREAAVVLQARVRGYLAKKEWKRKRDAVILLQAHTRGGLARKAVRKMKTDMYLSAKEKEEERRVILGRQKHLEEVLRRKKEMEAKAQTEAITDQEMVDSIFDFLPVVVGGQEGQAPKFELKKTITEEIDIDDIPMEEDLPRGDDDDDLDEYSFSKFASMYFQGAATHTHIRQRLRQPLLYHEDEGDVLASMTVWWIILRFLGDLPEPKKQVRGSSTQERFMPQELISRKDRRLSHMVGLDQRVLRNKNQRKPSTVPEEPGQNRKGSMFTDLLARNRKPSAVPAEAANPKVYTVPEGSPRTRKVRRSDGSVQASHPAECEGDGDLMEGEGPTLDRPLTSLEKLHIIVGYAIYLQSFIRFAPGGYAPYCAERLRRTVLNGVRGEPPAWLELQATKTKKPMIVSVNLMDGRSINLPVDSSSTSREICQLLSNKIKLKDTFGFSVYVALYEKVWALGSGREHVMDAISQCEQEHGSESSAEHVKEAVQECINSSLLEAKSEAKWVQMVSSAHAQGPYVSSRQKADSVKAEMVDYAREKWPMFFSRFFEVFKLSGPALPKSKFIVAINWTGITFLDEREKRLLELSFPEVTGVHSVREGKASSQAVSLLTLKGDFTLSGGTAEDMSELLTMFLSGLTSRSQYAVTLKEADTQDDPMLLSFKKGELIIIIKDDEFAQERGWIKGQNESTKHTGAVPTEAIIILPTLSKPTNQVMSLINLSPNQRKNIIQANQKETGTMERLAPATLKEFSLEYFRQPTKDVNRQVMSRNAAPERLWANSREPIRQPLLQKLVGNPELSHKACLAFTDILHTYMKNYPTKQMQSPLEHTDLIFIPATQNEALRDEIYCQIMKQMSSNNNRFSMEQGWQLLWLCCGMFPPSQALLRHTQRFLESRRREALAPDCLQRLQSSLRMEPRKLPPHQVEVDAVQQNSTQIFHKIHFPNDTEEIFEVATNTRIRDLIRNITKKLSLASADGFSIFVKTHDKVLSLNDTDYFFDSLRQITDWSKKAKTIKEGGPVNIPYLVFFMRKLWFNVIPGRDTEADVIFHFPQELPKYLRGYHVSTKEEMLNVAALLFRIKFSNDKSQFVSIPKVLKELVPADQLKAMSENEWKKSIVASFNKQVGLTAEEAKVAFLKAVCRWPTFGCAFFDVKQTSEPSFPDIVRIAISKQGLTIIHPKTKDVLANHPFNRIANWCSGSTYFHMTIGSLVKGSKFLCETSLAIVGCTSSSLRRRGWRKKGRGQASKMESATMDLSSVLSNQSSESCAPVDTTVENTLFGCFYILVFFLALNGNSLALWIFSHQRGASSPANVFLIHLAVADLSYVIILPLRATYHLTGGHWPFGEVPCRLAGFLFFVNMYASLYFLACVAGDRYLAVVHAVRSLKVRRARYAHIISFSLWALVTVSMAPLLITNQTAEVDGMTVCLQLYREKASRNALISLAVAFTRLSSPLSCYLLIIYNLHRGSRLEPSLKLRALRTIGLVMLIYVVCFLPYHVSRATFILGYNHPDVSCQTRRGLSLANRLTSSLTCLNGALDPLIYLFGAEKFRGTLMRLFCKDQAGCQQPPVES
ncbi:hypothetical protein F7725_028311 [Dissostichus mawsoni]|uniref:Uracil nucleotide/cysteinyl leukotriene receptor n=1 Tax=Dissostichus mawsoni TaxID=36200 RepID=A0A7J5XG07_DISMA|nr:hypothetical protein F7725_028311 [Dissostichus mawsoni]